jgi:REP element-mobilizing transposase RayT
VVRNACLRSLRVKQKNNNNTMYYWPERKNQRLKSYNYSSIGYYFVTFCTKWRIDYFGEIIDGKILLNDYWKIIQEWIIKTQNIRKEIEFDEYIIMPNHIHMIIIVKNMENQNFVGNAGMRSDSMIRSKLMMHPKKNVGPHVC